MNNASFDKSLDLKCPCGYQQKIPEEFAGKNLVCPKCQRMLRIELVLPTAELLSRCPFCQTLQNYDPDSSSCIHCRKEFSYPSFAPEKVVLADSVEDSPEFSIDGPSTGIPSVTSGAGNRSRRKKRSGLKPVIYVLSYLSSVALAGFVAYLILDKQENGFGGPESPIQTMIVRNDKNANSASSNRSKQTSTPYVKLKSPSLRIVKIQQKYDKSLNQVSSDIGGTNLLVEVQVKNLTECEVTAVHLSLEQTDFNGKLGPPVNFKIELEPPLAPSANQTIPFSFAPKLFQSTKVIITRVVAGNQSDDTRIEKVIGALE